MQLVEYHAKIEPIFWSTNIRPNCYVKMCHKYTQWIIMVTLMCRASPLGKRDIINNIEEIPERWLKIEYAWAWLINLSLERWYIHKHVWDMASVAALNSSRILTWLFVTWSLEFNSREIDLSYNWFLYMWKAQIISMGISSHSKQK